MNNDNDIFLVGFRSKQTFEKMYRHVCHTKSRLTTKTD